jgi:Sec-independent protein translocase protein TatA
MDTTSIAIIVVVVVAAFLFGGTKVRQWARTAGQAKGEFKAGEIDSEITVYEARERIAKAKAAAIAAEGAVSSTAVGSPHP